MKLIIDIPEFENDAIVDTDTNQLTCDICDSVNDALIIHNMRYSILTGNVRDINGNTVGTVTVEE